MNKKQVKNLSKLSGQPAPCVISPALPEKLARNLKNPKPNFFVADCVQFMQKMDKDSVDLTVTSPPYDGLRLYRGYSFDFESIARQLYRVTKPGGVVVWVVGDKIKAGRSLTCFKQGLFFNDVGFTMHDVMIYRKKNTPFMRSNAYTNCYEFMFVLAKGKPRTFNPILETTARNGYEMLTHNKMPDGVNKKILKKLKKEKTKTNIWNYAVGLHGTTSDKIAFQHPAVFPESLARDHILSWSNPGDLVFDPMCGSGTTGKMACLYGRRFIGVDISMEYVDIARRRLKGTVKNNAHASHQPILNTTDGLNVLNCITREARPTKIETA